MRLALRRHPKGNTYRQLALTKKQPASQRLAASPVVFFPSQRIRALDEFGAFPNRRTQAPGRADRASVAAALLAPYPDPKADTLRPEFSRRLFEAGTLTCGPHTIETNFRCQPEFLPSSHFFFCADSHSLPKRLSEFTQNAQTHQAKPKSLR